MEACHVLARLLLHGKAVKQTITTRAEQCCLATTPGIVGRIPSRIVMMTNLGLAIVTATRPVITGHILANRIGRPVGL